MADTTAPWETIRDEVTTHLQRLIRFNTVNPPGNETPAAQYLADVTRRDGIAAEVVESAPGRGNFVARIRGEGNSRPLLLMAHSDVVSVEPERWDHDPFGGEVIDGQVWGRGAVDTKDLVACELMVMLLVQRSGLRLDRDLIMATFADEETSGDYGASWMWRNRREMIDADVAINEGGGVALDVGGRRVYLCQTGEKGTARMRLTASGEPGHASVPLPDTAMRRAGRVLTTLTDHTFPTVLTQTVERMLRALAAAAGGEMERAVTAALEDPSWERLARIPLPETELRALYATTRNTAVPTLIHGGHRINVIPSEVTIAVDGRVLPGQDPEAFAADVQALLADDARVELTEQEMGLEADPDSALFRAIGDAMATLDPGATVVPYLSSGGTDAKCLPGVRVYGFMPMRDHLEEADLAHAHNERVSVSTLELGTRALYEIVTRYCHAR